jgi:hypothetical protein
VDTAYRGLLWLLLPTDFRRAFGSAMSADFAMLMRDARRQSRTRAARLAAREYLALVRCAPGEWMAKMVAAPFQRDIVFRDRSRMRPPGAGKASWYSGF